MNLKNTLIGNAVFSTVSSLSLLFFPKIFARLFEVEPTWIFQIIGFGLLPFALFVGLESQKLRPFLVKIIAFMDFSWVFGSLILLFFQPFEVSILGNILIAIVAVLVLFFGINQWKIASRMQI